MMKQPILILSLLMLNMAWAKDSCISLQEPVQRLEAYRADGLYRSAPQAAAPDFSYSKSAPYAQYLSYARALIQAKNPKADLPCPVKTKAYNHLIEQGKRPKEASARVVDLLAPFELRAESASQAILLVHGLTDSPFLLHDLAAVFYEQGITVRTLLLPGHGTAPAELLTTQAHEWHQAVNYALDQMDKDFPQVYLGGYSMGAALLMDALASRHPIYRKTKGIFLWSPASESRSPWAGMAKYVAKFKDWLDLGPDVDFAKYESFPYRAGAEVNKVMAQASKKIKSSPQNIPLFMAITQRDETISPASSLNWMRVWHDPKRRPATAQDTLIFYGMSLFGKEDWVKTVRLKLPGCRGQFTCDKIEGISHIAITNSPYNPHYGLWGSYRFCEHYRDEPKEYQQCKESKEYRWGAASGATIKRSTTPLRRLTFNPFFFEMVDEMQGFLQRTGGSLNPK